MHVMAIKGDFNNHKSLISCCHLQLLLLEDLVVVKSVSLLYEHAKMKLIVYF